MGNYYGVTQVEKIGNPVVARPRHTKPIIKEGYSLIAVMANGLWKIAGDVTSDLEYMDFVHAYERGTYIYMTLYEVPTERLSECPNEGRVPV